MSFIFYGAVRLASPDPNVAEALKMYWGDMAALHRLLLRFEEPQLRYLKSSDARFDLLWCTPFWVRFAIDEVAVFDDSMQCAERILGWYGNAQIETLWPRLPQWRCLRAILCHQAIEEIYLVLEDPSGDIATSADVQHVTLTEALCDLWRRNCEGSEDATVYYIEGDYVIQ